MKDHTFLRLTAIRVYKPISCDNLRARSKYLRYRSIFTVKKYKANKLAYIELLFHSKYW